MTNSFAQASSFKLHTTVPSTPKIRQIDGLQILRTAAVALVAWCHAGLNFGLPVPNLGIFGIDIFFVISGFIMSSIILHDQNQPGPATAWEFFQRRLIRIYPIYWLYALIGLIRLAHSGLLFHRNFVPAFFLLPLPQYPRIYDLTWTMMFEMFFYSTMAALLLLSVRWAVHLAIALFCVTTAIGLMVTPSPAFPVWAVFSSPMLLEFVFGACTALVFRRFGTSRVSGVVLLVLGVAFSFYLGAHRPPGAASMQMILAGQSVVGRVATWGLAAALLVAGTVFWSPSIRSKVGIAAVMIGNASYSAYLASTLVMEYFLRLLFKIFPEYKQTSYGWVLFFMISTVVAILGVGWISYQFVEWPMVRGMQRALKRRSSTGATA